MADKKISELDELTTPADEDLLATVDDPAGTPVTKKITKANLVSRIYDAVVAPSGGDYTTIQAALDAGKKTIFVRNGIYTTNANISIAASDITIIGENRDKTIIDFNNGAYYMIFDGAVGAHLSNIHIENIHFRNSTDVNKTLVLEYCDYSSVSHCVFYNNTRGVSFVGGLQNWCLFNSIYRSAKAGGYGIDADFLYNSLILGNYIEKMNSGGIYIHTCHNTKVINNTVKDCTTNFYGVDLFYEPCSFIGNTSFDASARGFYITGAKMYFSHNTSKDSGSHGFYISGDDNMITNNMAISNGGYGISLYNSGDDHNLIASNLLEGNSSGGIDDVGTGTNIKDNFGTDAVADKKFIDMKNTDGDALAAGDLVRLKAVAAGDEVEHTTVQGDDKVVGMAEVPINNGAYGSIQILGKTVRLKVDGTENIAIGDFIGTFTAAGIGQKAAVGDMAIAVALEVYEADDSGGVINALLITPRKI